MPPATTTEPLPRRSGGFELTRELGRGGMGVVYEAQELASGRRVALKVLLADQALSEEAFRRFQREARIAASISDSRCVFVYGAHQVDGFPAISMELVGGETLEHRIARGGAIPIETAVRWTIEILDGLEAASMAGVVHRDVKPSNCFLTDDGHVKVGDFGLARSLEADLRLTLSGQFLGSPLYASPEQVRGREVDQRSDIYSCGATLYALLAGRPPHTGDNFGEVLARILSEPPTPLREIRPEIPRGLQRVVARAMERDPAKRPQTHAEMRAALQSYVSSSSVPAHPLRRALAYAIDWALANMLKGALAPIAGALGYDGAIADPEHARHVAGPVLDVLVQTTPFLYFAVAEGLWGAAVGKWVLGIRVVGPGEGWRARGLVALRAAIFCAPNLAISAITGLFHVSAGVTENITVLLPTLVRAPTWVTMRQRNGWRALHEIASSTRCVQRRTPFASFARSAPPEDAPLAQHPDAPATVGDYVVEGAVGRSALGVLLQARDPNLNRPVWVLELADANVPVPEQRRMLVRAGRVRWLDGLHANGKRYEVFEAPGGASLLSVAARGRQVPFPTIHRMLSSLADELGEVGAERVSLHQLWIDRSWNLRVLDAPAGREPGPPLAPAELLVAAARALLPAKAVLPPDLPEHAEPAARRLYGLDAPFEDVKVARRALEVLGHRQLGVPRRTRATQIAFSMAPALLLALLVGGSLLLLVPFLGKAARTAALADELESGSVLTRVVGAEEPAVVRPLTDEEREARELLIATQQLRLLANANFDTASKARIERAHEQHPDPTDDEIAWAEAHLGPSLEPDRDLVHGFAIALSTTPIACTALWGIGACSTALLLGGGVSLRVFGLRVRDRRGRRASRFACLLRVLVGWIPILAIHALPCVLFVAWGTIAGVAGFAVAVTLHALLVAQAIAQPARGLQDRLLGTRLVPR